MWHPAMLAAIGYARGRRGDIAFAVRTAHRFYGYRPDQVEWSASVVKAMLVVAYLDQRSVARRVLNGYDKSLLGPRITRSDNNAANQVGLLDHQVALLVRGCARVSIAVLTMHDGSHAYGKQTLHAIFARLLRHLPSSSKKHRSPKRRRR